MPPFRQNLLRFAVLRARSLAVFIAVFVIAGWTGSWHRLPELFSHFFLQYVLVLVPATVLLFLGRDGIWRWVALAMLGATGCAIAPFWLPAEPAPVRPESERLRILQFNTASRNLPLVEWLAEHRKEVDVVLVLEAGAKFRAEMQALADEFPYHLEQLDDSPFSIALMSRHPLLDARVLEITAPYFPALQADILLNGTVVRLIGIHPPPPVSADLAEHRNQFMTILADRLHDEHAPGRETIIFGDFNSTVWSPHLRDFMARTGLSDAQRGQGAPGTWPAVTARHSGLFGIPIDTMLVSEGLAVTKRRIGPDLGSDHLPVWTEIAFRANRPSGN